LEQINISLTGIIIAFLTLLIPVYYFSHYKTELTKPMLTAFFRMVGQLLLVGIYLKYIFEWNSILINLLWVFIMIFAATFLIIKRSEIRLKTFFIPVISTISISFLFNIILFVFFIIGKESFFDARYIIPIAGMLIGNSITSTIIGLRAFFNTLRNEEEKYKFYLMAGATRKEALFDFIRKALKEAFNPTIASTATIGLIWLPGMMTGQILGGSDPTTAIEYQMIIVITIFVASVINVMLGINISKRIIFNKRDMLIHEKINTNKVKT
jgi:putative ABC transport system permease protein